MQTASSSVGDEFTPLWRLGERMAHIRHGLDKQEPPLDLQSRTTGGLGTVGHQKSSAAAQTLGRAFGDDQWWQVARSGSSGSPQVLNQARTSSPVR